MDDNLNRIKYTSLSLPITCSVRTLAQEFASFQPTPQKAEQVRLNTLAVCVVNDYLQMMGIPTDISKSDSWNSVVRLCADVADLVVIGVGRLECRPVKAFEQTYYIPPEVWEERIGYVVVQINESHREATVLGFAHMATAEQSLVTELQPLENLLPRLSQLFHL